MPKEKINPDAPPLTEASAFVQVRVLCDCQYGSCDGVAMVDRAQLAQAKMLGLVDDHPDAVAYAASLINA